METSSVSLKRVGRKRKSGKVPVSTSMSCAVKGCSNTSRKLKRWAEQECDIHHCMYGDEACKCAPEFELYPFPTKAGNSQARDEWIKLIHRQDPQNLNKLFEPKKDARVCSQHFRDGRPTAENPYPELNLGYNEKDVTARMRLLSPPSRKKQRATLGDENMPGPSRTEVPQTVQESKKSTNNATEECVTQTTSESVIQTDAQIEEDNKTHSSMEQHEEVPIIQTCENSGTSASRRVHHDEPTISSADFFFLFIATISLCYNLLIMYMAKMSAEDAPYYEKLLTDKNVRFYTNLDNLRLFHKLHDLIAPYVRRRYSTPASEVRRSFITTPKKFGPARKLKSQDEFLLVLMKLKLSSLQRDLCDMFNISESLCTNIFYSWIRAMSECLKSVVYLPDQGVLNVTAPGRYSKYNNLCMIIDCSELFIETPKDLLLQSATWSEYKHHTTVKLLIGVAPNSAITFISKAYTDRISDKRLTLDSGLLSIIPKCSTLMADKGFDLASECAAHSVYFKVPPGRRGMSQLSPNEVVKTSEIATDRILVEQVIRRLKTFRILATEIPISLLPHTDDILITCAALCNFMEPLYKD